LPRGKLLGKAKAWKAWKASSIPRGEEGQCQCQCQLAATNWQIESPNGGHQRRRRRVAEAGAHLAAGSNGAMEVERRGKSGGWNKSPPAVEMMIAAGQKRKQGKSGKVMLGMEWNGTQK